MKRPADLPDYDSPPVNEVVVGVQFDRLPLSGLHFGLFWSTVRDKLPNVSEQPPLETHVENFANPSVLRFPFVFDQPRLRYWLIAQDETELLQLQNDRLLFNWRKRAPEQPYPHFEWIQSQFTSWLANWQAFLAQQTLEAKIGQFEVTYLNRISSADRPLVVDEVLSFLAPQFRTGLGGTPEAISMNSQRVLMHEGVPWARGYTSTQNGIDATGAPTISFELTVRGPLIGGHSSLPHLQFRAREWIVRAFHDLTSADMHKTWGLR
jgi:uncharacterized protein (TIGR04255 family)